MNALEQIVGFFAPLVVAVVCLYLWAGICFLFFRYSRSETEARMRRFLEQHYSFYTYRIASKTPSAVTAHAMKLAGSRGWWMLGLPVINMEFGFSYHGFLLNNGMLFFGGLMFAYSWYGVRCLRLLGLDSYAK